MGERNFVLKNYRFPFPGRKIGLLGGSFNPAHCGHRRISIEAIKRLQLDAVWWLVTPQNPLKPENDLEKLEKLSELEGLKNLKELKIFFFINIYRLLRTHYIGNTVFRSISFFFNY